MELLVVIVSGVLTLVGSYVITNMSLKADAQKRNAEIQNIYTRLGIDKGKAEADKANTWMDVARKAADEYERVLEENVSLKKKVGQLERRIRSLESTRRKKKG